MSDQSKSSRWVRPPPPPKKILSELRKVALCLPEATEDFEGVGNPAYKVKGKIFAMQHQEKGRLSLWLKAPPGGQEMLIGSEPEIFFSPPYVGSKGWVGCWLTEATDWEDLGQLVLESYWLVAPKKLTSLLNR